MVRTPIVVIIVALTFGALARCAASGAATIESKKAEAAQLEAEIEANGERIAALGEQYNGAVLAYEKQRPLSTKPTAAWSTRTRTQPG